MVNSLLQNDEDRCEKYQADSEEEFITYINQKLLTTYPGLLFRWSRIYGSRWAHIGGNSHQLALGSIRLPINMKYGLSIDNPEILDSTQLACIIHYLKELFADVPVC